MSDSGKIAPTAHYTAYAWHVLGLPHAELFATPLGARLFRAYRVLELPSIVRGEPSKLLRTLKNRHALIDQELIHLEPDLIVELGAGLSRRGVTFALDHGVPYVEIDLPEMIAHKRALLERASDTRVRSVLEGTLRLVPADIMSDVFGAELERALQGAARPVLIAEGVLGYFDAPRRHKLLEAVHKALNGRGALLADLRVKGEAQAASMRVLRLGILIATRGRGASAGFRDVDEVRRMFVEAGFSDIRQLAQLEHDVLSTVWCARP